MKTVCTRVLLAGFLSLLFFSCEKAEDLQMQEKVVLSSNLLLTSLPDCSTSCIEDGGPYFEQTDQKLVQWGGRNGTDNSKTIDIVYYNTPTDFVLKVRSTNGWSDLVIDGVSSWTGGPVAANAWGELKLPLANGWKACDVKAFALQVAGNGPSANFTISYNLYGVCKKGCSTEFAGKALECGAQREAEYTFTAAEDLDYIKIQGGLTNFTGQDAVVTITGGTLTASQSTPGGSSNRVIKVEGSVKACDKVTINIKWNSTNTGGIITGSWSVKNAAGEALAPEVLGLTCN